MRKNINFSEYPKHIWLDVCVEQRIRFLTYLESIHIYLYTTPQNTVTMGIEKIIDAHGDTVSHIKWYWGNRKIVYETFHSICKHQDTEYVAIPVTTRPSCIWDTANSYVYMKPNNIDYVPLTESDILGWYIDRY